MNETRGSVTIRACHGETEYPKLVEIWRSAVQATHDFFAADDRQRIENNLASLYFPAVTLLVAEQAQHPVGFAGVHDGNLEMLFVTNAFRRHGIGTALLAEAVAHHGVTQVDVNEQNPDGRPYPILHLTSADS